MAKLMVQPYRRRLTTADVRLGSMLIDKSRWSFFPAPGQKFSIVAAGERYEGRIDAEECDCRPPHHQHLHLTSTAFSKSPGFRPGATLVFDRTGEKEYRLSIP